MIVLKSLNVEIKTHITGLERAKELLDELNNLCLKVVVESPGELAGTTIPIEMNQLLQDNDRGEKTFGEELSFVVTKLKFACGTVKYDLQAYSGFGEELEFGMFDTKEEAYERKDYYTKKDADYEELNLAGRYGPEEGE